jgi:hypothetical protein
MNNLPQHHHHGVCGCYTPPQPYPTEHQVNAPHPAYPQPLYAYPPQRPDRAAQVVKWGAAGALGSLFLLAFAVAAIAVAVGAVAVTICVLVLRGLWNDMTKETR